MRERHDQRAHGIRDRESDVSEQRAIEIIHSLGTIGVARCSHLAQHERMAAYGALPEDYETACQEIRAFDGDGHRHRFVAAGEIILRSEADALAAMHVHRIVCNLAAHFGDVILEHRRRYGRLLAAIDCACGDGPCGVHRVGQPDHARDDRLDAFESADRHVELAANARVGAG